MSVGWEIVPRVKDNPLGTQSISKKSRLVRAGRFTNDHRLNSRPRYMAEILPIRRKTQYNLSMY